MPSLFSGGGAEGWHAPAGRRTCEPRPLVQDGQIRPAVPVGAIKTWDPADRSFRRTTRAASAESEVRPGPRLPTLRPHHLKTGEAGPEALPTLSLPITSVCWRESQFVLRRTDNPVLRAARGVGLTPGTSRWMASSVGSAQRDARWRCAGLGGGSHVA